ncbi:hypothetical protein BDR26DRAFT_876063 [Obelidium mucronatum]|nr:hypothetical protein BDR26DRAFT_876063 [Obelidium mucronatum]
MGPPITAVSPTTAAKQATSPRAGTSGGDAKKGAALWFAIAAFCGLAALARHLLVPMAAPFFAAALLSVPLHRAKSGAVLRAMKVGAAPNVAQLVAHVLRFVLGPAFDLFEGYVALYVRAPSPNQQQQQHPVVDFEDDLAQPWPLFMLKWSLRATLVSLLWNSPSFRATILLVAAGLLTYRFAMIHLNASNSTTAPAPIPPSKLKDMWNSSITSLYIVSLVVLPILATVFFVNNLIVASPDLLYAGVSFIANPVPAYTPNPYSVIPDVGVRKLVLAYGVTEARAHIISALDAELSLSYPNRNVSCVEAAKIALGGFQVYKEKLYGAPSSVDQLTPSSASAEQFRARFPQVVEVIELAAYGQRIEALLKLGPAIAEIRWLGPDAFSFTLSVVDKSNSTSASSSLPSAPYHGSNVSQAELDPTGEVAGIVGPFFADLGFTCLVFFSTLGVLVYSDVGVHGYTAKLIGKELAAALIQPLDSAFLLNMDLLIYRVFLTHLVSTLVFPGGSATLQVLLPFVAVAATLLPMFPIFLPLGIVPAALLFVLFGSPWAAVVVLYIQMVWSPEQTIVDLHMGVDGIAIVDGFATWMGWMAFDLPAGLIAGPWCFVALRRVYSVIVDR